MSVCVLYVETLKAFLMYNTLKQELMYRLMGSGRELRKELRDLLRKMIIDWNGKLFLCLMALTKPRGTCAVSDSYLLLYGAQDVM